MLVSELVHGLYLHVAAIFFAVLFPPVLISLIRANVAISCEPDLLLPHADVVKVAYLLLSCTQCLGFPLLRRCGSAARRVVRFRLET